MNGSPEANSDSVFHKVQSLYSTVSGFIHPLTLFYSLLLLFCSRLPLLQLFDYEYAVTASLLAFIILPLPLLNYIKKPTTRILIGFVVMLILLPLIFGSISVKPLNADTLLYGVSWYLLLPVISFVVIYAVLLLITHFWEKYAVTKFYLFLIIVVLLALGEFYSSPGVGIYTIITGYLPGTIYDELIPITRQLLLLRFFTLLSSVIIIYFLKRFYSGIQPSFNKRPALLLGLSMTISYWSLLISITPGTREMQNLVDSYNTVSIFADNKISELPLNRIAEFTYRYTEALHYRFSPYATASQQRNLYLFSDAATKKRLTGIGEAEMTKPWRNEVLITESALSSSLAHELKHLTAAEFGWSPLKLSYKMNGLLLEGFASFEDEERGGIETEEILAELKKRNTLPPFSQLSGTFSFFTSFSGVAYLASGAFCNYLLKNYPETSFAIVYATGNYQEAYGKTGEQLYNEFVNTLSVRKDRIPLTEYYTEFYFNRPTIFKNGNIRYKQRVYAKSKELMAQKKYSKALTLLHKYVTEYRDVTGYRMIMRIYSLSGDSLALMTVYYKARAQWLTLREPFLLKEELFLHYARNNMYDKWFTHNLIAEAPDSYRKNRYSYYLKYRILPELTDSFYNTALRTPKMIDSLFFVSVIPQIRPGEEMRSFLKYYSASEQLLFDAKSELLLLKQLFYYCTDDTVVQRQADKIRANKIKPRTMEEEVLLQIALGLPTH